MNEDPPLWQIAQLKKQLLVMSICWLFTVLFQATGLVIVSREVGALRREVQVLKDRLGGKP